MSVVERAREKFKQDQEYWSRIYRIAREDAYFLSDREDAQWPREALDGRRRTNRPTLTIDQLTQYVNQVVNDIRENTPSIDVIPSTDGDIETAETYQKLIRNILYNSQADTAFDIAAAYAVRSSFGFIKISNDYEDNKSFEQKLIIEEVVDPFSCYLDSNSVCIDGSDAEHAFILEHLGKDEFEERFPDKNPSSFGEIENNNYEQGKEEYTIAEYYEIETKKIKLGQDLFGVIEEVQPDKEYVLTRDSETRVVKKYILSGDDVLEESEFVGEYIPLVPVYGSQMWVDGQREIHSLIRKSKDAQQMFNYWKSLETELLQKQPKAQFFAADEQVQSYADEWEDPETAVLRYKAYDSMGNQMPPPQRLEPPVIPTGVVQASRAAVDDIKATIGMYGSSLGAVTNEVSGVAIQRRNHEGDIATYHFPDNLSKSIEHIGRLLVCAIPQIYDTPRVIKGVSREEEVENIGINGAIVPDQERSYDLSQGKYEVKIVAGASYTTQRQEAAEFFNTVVLKNPELMNVMGDLLFKYMDFAGAPAMAERMKKFIAPEFREEEEEIDPQKIEMAQTIQEGQMLIDTLQQQIDDMNSALMSKQKELDIKAKSEQNKYVIDQQSNDLDALKIKSDNEKAQREYELKMQELKFKADAILLKNRELDIKEGVAVGELDIKQQKVDNDGCRESGD